jgi:hypothetical protein
MLFLEFFKWWYGIGWQKAIHGGIGLVKKIELSFSTFFALEKNNYKPWQGVGRQNECAA